MFGKLILAGVAITMAFVLFPPIKDVLDTLYSVMNDTLPMMTEFDALIWRSMPILILIAVFVGVIWLFRREDERDI